MSNNNTVKKIFEVVLCKSDKKPDYNIDFPYFKLIYSYENDKFIGYEVDLMNIDTYCKDCGQLINKIKDYRFVYPSYGIIDKKKVVLKVKKKILLCKDCKSCTSEMIPDMSPKAQKSSKFIKLLLSGLNEQRTYSSIAREYYISVSNVIYQFDKKEEPEIIYKTIRNIAIDEVRFIINVGKYQCVIFDNDRKEIIDILPERLYSNVQEYLSSNLSHIKTVTQDFWITYSNASKRLPSNPTIIVDKFHFVRFVMWAYMRTRRNLQKDKKLKLGKSWRLQNKSRKKLDKLGKLKVDRVIKQDNELLKAYKAKEYFLHIVRTNNLEYYREEIQKWINYVERNNLLEFLPILTTINNWSEEIENMFKYKYSNGNIERVNRTIKLSKNNSFGFRNLKRTIKLLKLRVS